MSFCFYSSIYLSLYSSNNMKIESPMQEIILWLTIFQEDSLIVMLDSVQHGYYTNS